MKVIMLKCKTCGADEFIHLHQIRIYEKPKTCWGKMKLSMKPIALSPPISGIYCIQCNKKLKVEDLVESNDQEERK